MKLAVCAMLAVSAFAQRPEIGNAKVEIRGFSGSLAAQLAQFGPGPFWAGYAEPAARNRRSDDCRATIWLEGQPEVVFLIRVESRRAEDMRMVAPDCRLDGGALPFYWIENVPAAASVAWLKTQVAGQNVDRAMSAIAIHEDPAASRTLIELARGNKDPKVRGKALTFLAQKAGDKQAAEVIGNAALNDPDRSVKERAVDALSRLPADQGIPILIGLAKTNSDPAVRKKAMFWLGQSKDPRALEFIAQVLSK